MRRDLQKVPIEAFKGSVYLLEAFHLGLSIEIVLCGERRWRRTESLAWS